MNAGSLIPKLSVRLAWAKLKHREDEVTIPGWGLSECHTCACPRLGAEASCLKTKWVSRSPTQMSYLGEDGRAGCMQAREGLQISLVGGAEEGKPLSKGWRRAEDK